VRALEGTAQLAENGVEAGLEQRPAGDDHVIVPGPSVARKNGGDRGPQASPNAIALHGAADAAGDGEADARFVLIVAHANLQREELAVNLASAGGGEEFGPPPQPAGPAAKRRRRGRIAGTSARQALSRLRPRARRAAITLRPPVVAMRARKPCRRFRTSLLGW
jgi:hypothetical protein